ncbi:hypothetical protein Pmar_PMAR028704 [Perkinsus marinus ATCC 50983]|uniref:Uncharacterized protein n=1 Tax=Perkinsus marinus (strain ATCC 50983 / TXsc) TaxID=423536 RepID=C5K8N1_PERM5|nr:hypothetical protein Pmar_PMAR028704 [Perkinsus marinus ATCC 50983]EER19238.1 hypothetical protein Pmar_PMAR028704 [Perkinsus marinus ATCC 50983]|eukprot:XP_002787442.1 hypothetical protein Pmar_PMAR028704 [Perkinsus marinus ATCC 50983]
MSQYKNNTHHQEEDTQHQHDDDEIRGEIAVLDNTPEIFDNNDEEDEEGLKKATEWNVNRHTCVMN